MRKVISNILTYLLCGTSFLPGVSTLPGGAGRLVEETLSSGAAPQQPGTPAETGLRIVVVSGDHGINVLKKNVVVKPVLEVRDATDKPVEGAIVKLIAPISGATVVFADGLRMATMITDANGRVIPTKATAVNEGTFEYEVEATYRGQTATAKLSQTNAETVADANNQAAATSGVAPPPSKKFPKWAMVALIGGAVVGIGVGVGAAMSGSSHTVATLPSAAVSSAGGASVGAPH